MTVVAQPNKPLTPKVNETTTTLEQLISLEGHIVEGQTINKVGHEVRVTIIQGGNSKNGFAYDQPTLQKLASMLEGAQAYADHDVNAPVRSVRDMVGYYTEAEYIAPSTASATGRVDATLHILEAASWLWSIIYESVSVGKPDLVGLSIDIFGSFQHDAGSGTKHVTGIRHINSCDIVTRPSAGGSFQRIIHSEQGDPSSMDLLTDKQQQNYQQEPPALAAGTPATSPDTTPPGYPACTLSGGQVRAGNTSVAARISEQQQHDAQIQSLLEQVRLERAQLLPPYFFLLLA